MKNLSFIFIMLITTFQVLTGTADGFTHPGCLSKQEDLARMSQKVAASEQPWKGSWDILVGNTGGFLDDEPLAQSTINVGGGLSENYIRLARDCAKAYQCALRYNISGEQAYGDKAVAIFNAWAKTMTGWAGDSNVSLRAGIYGYQMACAAELMRDYSGWAAADIAVFKQWLVDVFYTKNTYFMTYHHGTCDSHYWANWDLSNMASMLAIGVFCDNQAIFNEGLDHFYKSKGNGAIDNAVHYIHPDGLGQWQESGRDQGHATMGIPLMGTICEIGWNQGYDLYGYSNDKFLAGCEYVAKYNLGYDVPFVTYINCEYWINTTVSDAARGLFRPGWDMVYNHYTNRMGMATPYSKLAAGKIRPEGGGFNYGTNSGGFDQLGFTTLTHSLPPIAAGTSPGKLLAYVKGGQVTLSWRGPAYAKSYNIKRGSVSGGPYTTIATVGTLDTNYVDTGLTPETSYYYVVSANNSDGKNVDSIETTAQTDKQLFGTIIGSNGSYKNAGAGKELLFDGSLRNFYDAVYDDNQPTAWAGLDLGEGAAAVITQVKYCPRPGMSQRMVGGIFQGSNTADFSSGTVDLFTITDQPTEEILTTKTITNNAAFRYVRYLSTKSGCGNAAEIQFLGNVTGQKSPATPAGLNISDKDGGTTLSWNTSSGASGYYLKRATISGGPYTIIANGNFTSFSDTTITDNNTYYYIISAYNNAGQSADSAEISKF